MALTSFPFRYALTANSMSTSFTVQNATATAPSGAGVFDLTDAGLGVGYRYSVPTWLQLVLFGKDLATETFDMRVYGYSETVPADLETDTALYIPQLLVDLSATLSTITFSDHAADTFLVGTLTVNKGPADNADWGSIINPAGNLVASYLLNTHGCRFIKFDFDMTGAASGNCLWRPVE